MDLFMLKKKSLVSNRRIYLIKCLMKERKYSDGQPFPGNARAYFL